MISFIFQDIELVDLSETIINKWVKAVVKSHTGKLGDINFIFCSDTYILEVNNQFLKHDYFTDIITFDYTSGSRISGDLIISVDTVLSNSKLFEVAYSHELNRVMIHGILHLLGFKDKTDEEALLMRCKEDEALQLLTTFL